MALDTTHISFVIEKDGSLSTPEISGYTDTALKDALKDALSKCKGWTPRMLYGMPVRSRMTLSYKELGYYEGKNYVEHIDYKEDILGF